MSGAIDYLGTHWLAGLMVVVALVLGGVFFWKRRSQAESSLSLIVLASILALIGLGGLVLPLLGKGFISLGWGETMEPAEWGQWLAGIALALGVMILFVKAIVLILSGRWWAPAAWAAGVLFLIGLGGLFTDLLGQDLVEDYQSLRSLEFKYKWWLLLLGLLPVIVVLGLLSLAGLGPVRRWLVIGLSCLTVAFLSLALTEPYLTHQNDTVTVLFVVDRSFSVPEEMGDDPKNPNKRIDLRWDRIEKFINNAIEQRGGGHKLDKAGVILFGRRPKLELPPAAVERVNFKFIEASSNIDGNYTDIAAAIKLALASFPEGSGKRVVLISDGNENLGNAEEQALLAKQNGVQIDVVPLASGQVNENEVLVQSIEAPTVIEQGSQLPIRVLIRSYNPNVVVGTLTVRQISEGVSTDVPGSPRKDVRLQPGLNAFTFKQGLTEQQRSYTYEAEFQPEWVLNEKGDVLSRGLAGDRVQNNRATTHVIARGQRRILFVEARTPDKGQRWPHQFLIDKLEAAGKKKYQIHARSVASLDKDKDKLAVFLSAFDCVILANVPADSVTDGQQEVLASNTREQGCGLIMIGGPDSFGAGGWQKTAVEKALPVDCDIQSLKVQGKGGLVLIMHASEIAQGNFWQKKVAKLAIEKLSSADMCGMTYYGLGGHTWHIPFQEVGDNRAKMLELVDSMSPGDMPDVDPALNMAHKELTDPKYDLATRHIIFISDGDHWMASPGVVAKLRADKITCSTVCITSHGQAEITKMRDLALATGGKPYAPAKAEELPEIYIKETRFVSQSFIHETKFLPKLMFQGGPTEKLDPPPNLHGYVRTTPKASRLVELPILTPSFGDKLPEFPILAYWRYGLGKAAAFTSDACQPPENKKFWGREWAGWEQYSKFWEQLIDWSLRPVESSRLNMVAEYRDGKVKVIVEAREDRGGKSVPLVDLTLRGGVTTPGVRAEDARKLLLKFEQKNSGVYEAEFKAEEAGSYFISAQATRKVKIKNKDGEEVEVEEGYDSVRSGLTIPYSPEFADMESNKPLLNRLRELTGGEEYDDDADALAEAAKSGVVFRESPVKFLSSQAIWFWLLFLAGALLFVEVAVRRIAIDPHKVAATAQQSWDRLRGRAPVAEETAQFIERLKSRKAQVSEAINKGKAAQRFEGDDTATAAPAGAHEVPSVLPTARPARPTAQPQMGPDAQEEAADYVSRLKKAKKRVWQDRQPDENE